MYRHPDDEIIVSNRAGQENPSVVGLIPIMAVVLIAFVVIGLALPVLPLHVHHDLGFGAFIVGLVTGSQFGASLLSRLWGGRYADRRGPKQAVIAGLLMATLAGLLYILSVRLTAEPSISVAVLLLGRALLGAAESFIITGAISWGLAVAGAANAGRVIAWIGMAMFAALASGAPLGSALYAVDGFIAVAAVTTLIPLATILLVAPLSAAALQKDPESSLLRVAAAVWLPGFGSALSTVGFGAIITFGSLLAAQHGWNPVWLVFSVFAASLVVARLLLGHVPDRLGGAGVALVCVLIEAAGLALIGLAPVGSWAIAGAAPTGCGYSLVYPSFGVEAVRRAPPQSRGLVMGAYTVFLDVALGFGSPALGLVAGRFGFDAAFLISALITLGSAAVALRLLFADSFDRRNPCLMSS